jgi:transposase
MWLTGRLRPDFKTIANFRKDNGKAIRGAHTGPRDFSAM